MQNHIRVSEGKPLRPGSLRKLLEHVDPERAKEKMKMLRESAKKNDAEAAKNGLEGVATNWMNHYFGPEEEK